MKKIYTFLAISLVGMLVSCSKSEGNEGGTPQVPAPVETIDEPLTSLSVSALNALVGVSKETLMQRLQKDNVSFQDNDYEIVYYTTKAGSPFNRYKVVISFSNNVFDLDKKPYELYRGVYDVEIRPVDEAGQNVVEGDYKKVFDYFYPLFTNIQPNQKPLSMRVENTDVEPKIQKEETSYEAFVSDMSNVDGVIVWNNNPPMTEVQGFGGRKNFVLLSENSNKAKNTPIVTMNYWYERKGWKIRMAFNAPYDWYKNVKK